MGEASSPGFSTTNGQDISGSTEGARIDVVGNPYLNLQPGTYFNIAAFARPAKGTFGNAGTNSLTGPGINNWDISVSKRFVFSERRLLRFRTELFNAWNHTQFSGLYTSASF